MAHRFPTKEDIVAFLKSCPAPPKKRQIAQAFNIKGEAPRVKLKQILKQLKSDGLYFPAEKAKRVLQGVFVLVQKPKQDPMALLLKHDEGNAAPTEKIYAVLENPKLKISPGDHFYGALKGRTVEVLRRLEKQSLHFIGRAHKEDGQWFVTSIDKKNGRTHKLDIGKNSLKEGVFIKVMGPEKPTGFAQLESIVADANHISQLVIHAHHLTTTFSDEALREAQKYNVPVLGEREDLRDIPLVTIDGSDSRDFDDAVWAEPTPTGWHIIVGIADVAYYVRPGTPLDEEAFARSTSTYFPDKVVPMLPEYLSNGLCSLNPNEDRGALVAHIWIDKAGTITSFHFKRALIKSAARLTYEQVEEYIHGNKKNSIPSQIYPALDNLIGAHKSLKQARLIRGALDIHSPEIQVIFDAHHNIQNIGTRDILESHNLIEEFMVSANVAAAKALEKKGLPCMYRIHEEPDQEKVVDLKQTLKNLAIHFIGPLKTPADFNKLLDLVKNDPTRPIVNEMVLRCQTRAIYASRNIGHFGLNLTHYAHFTSPIRRYADLLVHRALLSTIEPGDDSLPVQSHKHFPDWAEHISKTEHRAVVAERDANDRFVTSFLAEHVGESYKGYVSGVSRAGIFISLEKYPISGLLPMEALTDDYYKEYRQPLCLKGQNTGKVYKLGDRINIVLASANLAIGRVSFMLDQDNPSSVDGKKSKPFNKNKKPHYKRKKTPLPKG